MTLQKLSSLLVLTALITACGGSSSLKKDPGAQEPPIKEPPVITPANALSSAYFRDQDSQQGMIAGKIEIPEAAQTSSSQNSGDSIWVYWADQQGEKLSGGTSEAWLKTTPESLYEIIIPEGTVVPEAAKALLLVMQDPEDDVSLSRLIKFHDFTGNTQLSGPGGHYLSPWYYGTPESTTDVEGFDVIYIEQRNQISIHRNQEGNCVFDNGLVSIIDMNYERDIAWENGRNAGTNTQANVADDVLFPIYQYPCAENPVNTHRYIGDEDGAYVYSTLNDAMFYGTLVYDTFVKYLAEPPIDDKLRIRVHYGSRGIPTGYWDGTYATFGDGIPLQLSASSLDSIGHEVGHGVLNRLMGVDFFQDDISKGFRTLHEAFSDISGVMAWYEYRSEENHWLHGEENLGRTRHLDQIITEYGAIASMLEYDETEPDNYLSIGMITYPFYVLSQQWGMEEAYALYVSAARNCWTSTVTHTQVGQCLKQQAALISTEKKTDVVAAFQTVKIKLFEDGVLSHFYVAKEKLRTQFMDDSRSTETLTEWHWDFGDGQTSTEQNPQHTYATSGDYQVKLTLVGFDHFSDDFTRTVSVTDQYCRITTGLDSEQDIGQVDINGTDLGFQIDTSDYRDLPAILLNGPDNRTLDLTITGVSNAVVDETIKWTVWLDINDDGVFTEEEVVQEETLAAGLPYAWNTSIDLADFISAANVTAGEAKFIRVVGEHSYSTACSSAIGEAFDVRVVW